MALFQNEQWVVTKEYVETAPGIPPYHFDISRIFETTTRGDKKFYDWPLHMAEKTWVNTVLFIAAFEHAIRYYSGVSGQEIDETMLAESYTQSILIAAKNR